MYLIIYDENENRFFVSFPENDYYSFVLSLVNKETN